MKEKMHFEIVISAPVKKVWNTMLTKETYKKWTSVFEPTSYYEGSWDKGSNIKFLGADGSGMVSQIVENIAYKFVSIRHLGEMIKSAEIVPSDENMILFPAFENYTFTENGGKTHLAVDMEMPSNKRAKEMKEMFEGMWPKALLKLKEICEK